VLVTASNSAQIPLGQLADLGVVMGPSMISSENGLLRGSVLMNVRGRDVGRFVDEAQRAVAREVKMPPGYYIEWSGQYENQISAKKRLELVIPVVFVIIFLLLYKTYNSFKEASHVILAVPFALSGGVFLLKLLGYNFSVAVWVGFIALFGTAVQTGVVMVIYLEEAVERMGTRLFVNVPDKKEIEVIDLGKRTVLARWPVTSAQNNFPMALDEAHHRLFVGCWVPPRLLVFDTETGKEVAAAESSGSTDDLFYDSRAGRVYVLTSQGFLDAFQQRDPDHYDRIARYPTPPGTQTGLFVPEWGKLFAAVRKQGEQSAELRVYQAH